MDATSGVLPFNSNKTSRSSGDDQGSEKEAADRNKQIQMTFLNSVAADFYRLLHLDQNLEGKPIDIQVTTDGLRVTLFDRGNRPLFKTGSTEFTEWGTFILQNLAWTIDRHRFRVTIDGHAAADAPPADAAAALDAPPPKYTKWELSADRANAARRSLVHYAVDPGSIERVTGYADTRPLTGDEAGPDTHDRVTLNLTLTSRSRFKDSTTVERPVPVQPQPTSPP
jgi:chemotaxis protein MotB